jgi:hypothetical protein
MRYLAQNLRHTIPGDTRAPGCIHLAWDGDIVYTTHRGDIRNPAFLSAWDITNRESPKQLPILQEPDVSYEGVDVANGTIFVGLHEKGLGAIAAMQRTTSSALGQRPDSWTRGVLLRATTQCLWRKVSEAWIAYIAREYDPDGLVEVIDKQLAD